jgi:hypothetical protein
MAAELTETGVNDKLMPEKRIGFAFDIVCVEELTRKVTTKALREIRIALPLPQRLKECWSLVKLRVSLIERAPEMEGQRANTATLCR